MNKLRSFTPLSFREKLFVFVALSEIIVLYAPTGGWLYARWTISVWQNLHGLFLPPLFLYLVWEKFSTTSFYPRQSSGLGFIFVVPALLALSLDAGMKTQLISAMSLIIMLPGLSLLFLGKERTRSITFPFLILVFMLPVPLAAIERLNLILRQLTTDGFSTIFPIFNIPFFVEGTSISIPGEEILVGDACSGFSTLYAMVVAACILSHWCGSNYRRVAVLLFAPPIAIFANILRTTSLILLVRWQGIAVLNTMLHPLSGLVMFAFALTVLMFVGKDSNKHIKKTR